jgi:Kelch motif
MTKLRLLVTALSLFFAASQLSNAQHWVPLVNQPNLNLALSNPLLLTDGTVIMHEQCGPRWWRLMPDAFGSYVNGTWKQIASLPSGYAPLYFGSAVLPDGRVMVEGGEYNFCHPVWTNQGAIYDPKTNKWTTVAPPSGWANIGDAQSVILANGTYMQASCCTTESALLDATNLTWTMTGQGKKDVYDEEGWTLLPNGTVLTVDAYVFAYQKNGKRYEIYHPSTGKWTAPGLTPVQLWDSYPDANHASYELGPGVLRPDGTVFYLGANGAPGQAGHTATYDSNTKTWTAGPDIPDLMDAADGPAALLPGGSVLFQASPGIYNTGSRFFTWDGTQYRDVTGGMTDAPTISSYYGNMLLLPTGQVLYTDFANVWVFQNGGRPNPAWLPQILSVPTTLSRWHTYQISGLNFNGFSQGGAYGDDYQGATNYPLVQITNRETGQVFYARTHDHSTMAIAYTTPASTNFDVTGKIPTGLSDLRVVVNGIASLPVTVNIR